MPGFAECGFIVKLNVAHLYFSSALSQFPNVKLRLHTVICRRGSEAQLGNVEVAYSVVRVVLIGHVE